MMNVVVLSFHLIFLYIFFNFLIVLMTLKKMLCFFVYTVDILYYDIIVHEKKIIIYYFANFPSFSRLIGDMVLLVVALHLFFFFLALGLSFNTLFIFLFGLKKCIFSDICFVFDRSSSDPCEDTAHSRSTSDRPD